MLWLLVCRLHPGGAFGESDVGIEILAPAEDMAVHTRSLPVVYRVLGQAAGPQEVSLFLDGQAAVVNRIHTHCTCAHDCRHEGDCAAACSIAHCHDQLSVAHLAPGPHFLTLMLTSRQGLSEAEEAFNVYAEASVPFALVSPHTSPHTDPAGDAGAAAASVNSTDHSWRQEAAGAFVHFVSPAKNSSSFIDPRNVTLALEVRGLLVPNDGCFDVELSGSLIAAKVSGRFPILFFLPSIPNEAHTGSYTPTCTAIGACDEIEHTGVRKNTNLGMHAQVMRNEFRMTLPALEVGDGRDFTLSVFLTDNTGQRTWNGGGAGGADAHIIFYVWPDHSWVPRRTVASGPGLSKAIAGQISSFSIIPRDSAPTYSREETHTVSREVETYSVILRGPSIVVADVAPAGAGVYHVKYFVAEPGFYSLGVCVSFCPSGVEFRRTCLDVSVDTVHVSRLRCCSET